MKDKKVEKAIPRLVGGAPMAYDLKPNGLLVVIDGQGAKHTFTPEQYTNLIIGKVTFEELTKKEGEA